MTSRRGLSASTSDDDRESKPHIYPYFCRVLSLTLGRWCPLKASDVFRLKRVEGFGDPDLWFYGNHMIKYVRLVGVIVAVDELPMVWLYTLDDGSGANIEATCSPPPKELVLPTKSSVDAPTSAMPSSKDHIPKSDVEAKGIKALRKVINPDGLDLTNIDVGSVVKIKGTVVVYREQMKIRLKAITIIRDTKTEVKCWNDAVAFRREVLAKPWVVTKEQESKCREAA